MKIFKKLALICCALSLPASALAADGDLLAFPGAEGFGRYAKGARAVANPEIYHVTNLNDDGAGSFRDAVGKEGRIIVFDVAGTINLKSNLTIKGKNTILGQTAPGEGVQIYGNRISFSGANEIIVRNMRFRMGINGESGKDACGIANGENMIFDHLSVLWGRDENFSVNWDNKGTKPSNITIQNSIIGQGLMTHACGGLIQTDGGVTLFRNLYIENKTRNPKVKGLNQYVNNVVYNWGNGGCYIMGETEGASWAHIENNYFIKGPWNGSTAPFIRGSEAFHFYGAGNYYDENKDGVLNGELLTTDATRGWIRGKKVIVDGVETTMDWASTPVESLDALNNTVIHEVIHGKTGDLTDYGKITSEQDRTIPQPIPVIKGMMSAKDALDWIIANGGPVLPARDEVDQYLIDELITYGDGSKNGISSEQQLPHKGTGIISGGVKPLDTDGDGIPDAWETANGLNPNDPADALALNAEGYTNLEAYSFTIDKPYPYIKKPVKLAVTDQQKESLTITWDLNKNTEHGFEIETSTDGKTFAKATTAAAGATTATITGLTPRTPYWVRLRAVGADGLASDYTDIVATETIGDPSAPAPSTDPFPAVGAKQGVAAGVTFKWVDDVKAYGGDVTYAIYLGTSAETLEKIKDGLTVKEWECKTLEAGKTYYWRVDATNSIGTTTGTVWSFSATAGGVLFYADFNTQPEEYGAKYASITDNADIYNGKANVSTTFNGMVIGIGSSKGRIVALNGNVCSEDPTAPYGPATETDAGASPRAIQFVSGSGYVTTPVVQGPCVVTYYLGNTGTSQQTVKLYTIVGGQETSEDLVLGAKKSIFKFSKTYTNAGEVQFRLDSNGKKVNVNDILVERYVAPEGEQALELTAGKLDNTIDYTDGSLSLTFNQEVKYNGAATISGVHQFEEIAVSASGTKLNIAYDALDANSEYSVKFVAGDLTDAAGKQSFVGEVKITTGDLPRAKAEGETHWGKAVKTLPINFAPFNEMAPFESVDPSLVQAKQSDYPHWCQVSGDGAVTADNVTFTAASKNDKVMTYFDGTAQKVFVDLSAEAGTTARVKIQETRNADVAPTWRTIRVLTEKDFPFKGEFELNPESRFVKIVPTSLSGTVKLNGFRVSDAQGFFGDDYTFESGIDDIIADTEEDDNAPVYNLLGVQVDKSYKGIVIKNGRKYIQR